MPRSPRLTHLDARGQARMVDVGGKPSTQREALAEAALVMKAATLKLMMDGAAPKGDVVAAARIAGIQAAKRTHELIPLCHPIAISGASVEFEVKKPATLRIVARVRCKGETGVEMEALTAASIAALTVYDMLKALDRGMEIVSVRLLEKKGGRSGHWKR